MSIYPVKLSEWFPPGDEMYSFAYMSVQCLRCHACGSRMRYRKAVGMHSVPWGVGEVWCGWKCCESGKVARPDKRRERRMKRRYTDFDFLVETIK
jgi:hypothetical protein